MVFGLGKKKKKIRKRPPKLYKRKGKILVRNGNKAFVLPVKTQDEAFNLLTSRNIYTKAKRQPSSLAREEMLSKVSDQQLKKTMDQYLRLRLLESINNKPQIKLGKTQSQEVQATPTTNAIEQQTLTKSLELQNLKAARQAIEKSNMTQDEKDEAQEKLLRDHNSGQKIMYPRGTKFEPEPEEKTDEERMNERMVNDSAASAAALEQDALLAEQEYKKNMDDLVDRADEGDVVGVENELTQLNADIQQMPVEVAPEPVPPLLEARADNLEVPVEQIDALIESTLPVEPPKPPKPLTAAQISKRKGDETKRRQKAERERIQKEYAFMTPKERESRRREDIQREKIRLEKFLNVIKKGSGKLDDTGMTDTQINNIMDNEDKFLGTIPRDEILKLIPAARHALDQFGEFGFIMNIDTRKQAIYEHWVAIYLDADERKELCYYDPFGEPPPFDKIITDLKTFVKKLDLPYLIKFKYNTVVNQDINSSRCGIFSMMFLEKMFSGWSFKDATNYKQSEKNAKNAENTLDKFGYL